MIREHVPERPAVFLQCKGMEFKLRSEGGKAVSYLRCKSVGDIFRQMRQHVHSLCGMRVYGTSWQLKTSEWLGCGE